MTANRTPIHVWLFAIAGLFLVGAVAAGFAAIWAESEKLGSTSVLALGVAVITAIVGVVTSIEHTDGNR